MKGPRQSARRGQPLAALAMVLACWIGGRSLVLAAAHDDAVPAQRALPGVAMAKGSSSSPAIAAKPQLAAGSTGASAGVAPVRAAWPLAEPVRAITSETNSAAARATKSGSAPPGEVQDQGASTITPSPQFLTPRIAAGHQMLWLAALAQLPLPDLPQRQAPPVADARNQAAPITHSRWSADGWFMLRRGGNGFNLPGAGLPGANLPSGAYGASQAGAVIRFHLAPSGPLRPILYLRATTALRAPRGEEVAGGLALRPMARLPIAAMFEARVTHTTGGMIVRPAAALVSEFPPLAMPLGLRSEIYVQAGYAGGGGATAFVDGQVRLEHRVLRAGPLELRGGGGAWGGAQRGAQRLDVGPTATLALPLGPGGGRLSADWRFRVAGNAAPTSGPALTLSAGF